MNHILKLELYTNSKSEKTFFQYFKFQQQSNYFQRNSDLERGISLNFGESKVKTKEYQRKN